MEIARTLLKADHEAVYSGSLDLSLWTVGGIFDTDPPVR